MVGEGPIARWVLGLLRLFQWRQPWAGHTSIAAVISRMVFPIRIHVLWLQRVMLKDRNGPNRITARREEHHHRPIISLALEAMPHHVPTTQSPMNGHALVVGSMKPDAAGITDALGNRWAAILCERGGVQHATLL